MSWLNNAWNRIFAQQGKIFTEPHEDMPGIVQLLKAKEANTVLDLGSGTGRHVVYLAKNSFSVFGLDNSPEGLKETRRWLADEGLKAELRVLFKGYDVMDIHLDTYDHYCLSAFKGEG